MLVAFAPCWGCRETFTFDPDTVSSIPIDPETGLPPGIGGTDPQQAVKQPLCPQCVKIIASGKGTLRTLRSRDQDQDQLRGGE